MHHSNIEVVNQHENVGSPVGSSNTNVVQLAVQSEAHFAELINAVSSHTRQGVTVAVSGTGLWSSCIGNRRCGPMLKRRMWSNLVVDVSKLVKQYLKFLEVGRCG